MNEQPPSIQSTNKPCGYEYFCPLYDENRLFLEGIEKVGRDYSLLGITRKYWCQGHKPRNVTPDLVRCRQVLADMVEENQLNRRIAHLQKELTLAQAAGEAEKAALLINLRRPSF